MVEVNPMLTADDRLVLVRVKIQRAKKHLLDLEAELGKFPDEYFHIVASKGDFKAGPAGDPSVAPILPFNVLPTAGDIVHNLRSALDHLAYQLVLVGSPDKEPSRRVEFPIAKDLATYEAEKAGKVEGMRPVAIKYIDFLKPYKGGNQVLWRVHELDNIDKHRTLFTVGSDYLFFADWLPGGSYWLKTGNPHFAGIFDPEVEKDVQLEIQEAFGKAKVTQSDALLPSLHDLVTFVEETVFSFKPLLE